MGAFTLSRDATSTPAPLSETGAVASARLSHLRPFPKRLPKDPIGRDITILLFSHPELTAEFGNIRLKSLSADEKAELLIRLRERLGIKPIKSRRLPYVGP